MASQRPEHLKIGPVAKTEQDERNVISGGQSDVPGLHRVLPLPSPGYPPPPQLSPPSHLDPPFAPRSPQLRPHFLDISQRQGSYSQAPVARPQTQAWSGPSPVSHMGQHAMPGNSLPPIYAPRSQPPPSVQTSGYGSPISPTGLMPRDLGGPSSAVDDSISTRWSTANPSSSQPPSARSSVTSSSGLVSRAPMLSTEAESSSRPASVRTKIEPENKDPMCDRYILRVRQQPLAARACGFGERDRRVLDPPAVVDLSLKDYDPTSSADVAEMKYPFHVVHCSLISVPPKPGESKPWDPKPAADVTSVPDPSKLNAMCRRLMGTLVATPFTAIDPDSPPSSNENARLGCFFIFSDLSIRQTGKYQLRFNYMKVSMESMVQGGQNSIQRTVDSDVFEVFVAGNFPGMSPSSHLIKELKKQGAPVSLKKGAPSRQKRGGKDNSEASTEEKEGSEVGDSESAKSRHKKKRG